jgi:DNA-binding GntR family transcriptional regulator
MPNTPETLSDQAYDVVEHMIVTLELPPGSIFSEGELSERVGIGRTPLREALQRLSGDRLVVAVPRRGILVTEINAVEYLSLLETRGVLDRLIAEQAARRSSPDERAELEIAAAQMLGAARDDNSAEFMKYDKACDRILESACRNPYAYQAASSLHAHCRRFWSVHRHHGSLLTSAELHAAMMTAVARGNSPAAGDASDALMDYLLAFTRKALDLD